MSSFHLWIFANSSLTVAHEDAGAGGGGADFMRWIADEGFHWHLRTWNNALSWTPRCLGIHLRPNLMCFCEAGNSETKNLESQSQKQGCCCRGKFIQLPPSRTSSLHSHPFQKSFYLLYLSLLWPLMLPPHHSTLTLSLKSFVISVSRNQGIYFGHLY